MTLKADTERTVRANYLTPTGMPRVLSEFLIDRDLNGVRPATLTYYRNELGLFLRSVAAWEVLSLEDLTIEALRAYFLGLRKRRNTKGVHTNFGAVKTFLKWAWGEYDMPGECPILKVKVAAPGREPKPGIPLADAEKLLSACVGACAKRDRAILLFLLDTGLRRREVCVLTVGQVQGETVALAADGTKTGRARTAFLSRETLRALRAYLATRGDLTPSSPLFAAHPLGTELSPNSLYLIIVRLCKRAGVPLVGLHDFRRTFALESLRAGADLVTVSRMLGHSQLETTKTYLAQTDEDLRDTHTRTSPVHRLKRRGR